MPLDAVVRDSLLKQVNIERYNAAIYSAAAHWLAFLNLPGAASYFHKQAAEEMTHSQRFADYLIDRNEQPQITVLDAPPVLIGDMTTAITTAAALVLRREQINTEYIKTIYAQAEDSDDPQTCVWLVWALEEQTRAERELTELIARATFAQGCPAAILALDHELGGA